MPSKYYTRGRFVLLFFFIAALLLLRKPDLLTNPQLFAEDATVFFREQTVFPQTAVFFPYNGQFHLVPRLIALLEVLMPLAAVAVFCSMVSVLIHAFCVSVFFFPWNRWLVANDLLRAAASVVLATTLDGGEMLGFSGPLMWYLFLAGVLLLFRPEDGPPQSRLRRFTLVGAMSVIGLSVAPMITLAPMAGWVAIKRRGIQRALALALLAVMVVQGFALLYSKRSDHPAEPRYGVVMLAFQVATATVVSWTYAGVITPLAGKGAAVAVSRLPTIGPALFVLIGIVILVTWLLTTSPPGVRLTLAIGLYLAIGPLASALYTRNLLWLSWNLTATAADTPARYMVLSGAVLIYLVILLVLRSPLRDPRLQAACLLLLFARGISHNFYEPPYGNFPWRAVYPKVAEWRAARAEGRQKPMGIPIAPAPWTIELP